MYVYTVTVTWVHKGVFQRPKALNQYELCIQLGDSRPDCGLRPAPNPKPQALPIVSIVVPFFGYPVLWLGSYNRDFG